MKLIRYPTIVIAIIMLMSCTQAKPTTAISEQEKEFNVDAYLKEREVCQNKIHPSFEGEMVAPTPLTLADKRLFAENKSYWMSVDLLKQRLIKNNIYHLFELELEDLNRSDNYGSLSYRYNGGFASRYSFIRIVDAKLEFIAYNFDLIKSNHTITSQERQEILPLINVVVDNLQKSAQILSELEIIYQDKLARKELLTSGIIVANVEYQGRLFELKGAYHVDRENPQCSVDGIEVLSIT